MGCCASHSVEEPVKMPQPIQMGYVQQGSSQQQLHMPAMSHGSTSFQPPFLMTTAPTGARWAEYVKCGSIHVDPSSGLLAGPWAECICWGVRFEHSSNWQMMPEYSAGDGPVGGIMAALEAAVAQHHDSQQILAAANLLEEVAHSAANAGRPLPLIDTVTSGAVMPGSYLQQGHFEQTEYSQYSSSAQYPSAPSAYNHFGQAPPQYSQPGFPGNYQSQYGPTPGYGDQAPYGGPGPTLLQQHSQSQGGGGMGTGAKVAMAAAGGLAAGVGGYYLASHMDEVGEAFGGAAHLVGDTGEAALGFVGGAAEHVGDFMEDMF